MTDWTGTPLYTIAVFADLFGKDTLILVNLLAGSVNPGAFVCDSFSGGIRNGYYVTWCQFSAGMRELIERQEPLEWYRVHAGVCEKEGVEPLTFEQVEILCNAMLFGDEADAAIREKE